MVAFLATPADLYDNQLIEGLLLGWWVLLEILGRKGVHDFLITFRSLRSDERSDLGTMVFEAFDLLTLIFLFDYVITGLFSTPTVSIWPYGRGVEEFTQAQ